jgi:hypothetical protein
MTPPKRLATDTQLMTGLTSAAMAETAATRRTSRRARTRIATLAVLETRFSFATHVPPHLNSHRMSASLETAADSSTIFESI